MIRVGLIGCGMIAGDLDDPGSEHVLTHAKAVKLHPEFELAGCLDQDQERARALADKWGCPRVFASLEEMISSGPEAYVVAASSGAHFRILQTLLAAGADLIVCEKPLVENLADLETLEGLLASSRARVAVNFQRRFDPAFRELEGIIKSGELGEPIFFQGGVGKGLIHNGCHLIDLLFQLLAPVAALEPFRAETREGDLYGTFGATLADGTTGVIQNTERARYGLLDLEIFFTQGRVSIQEIGFRIRVEKRVPWPTYPGFHHLVPWKSLDPALNRVFHELYQSLAKEGVDFDRLLKDALAGTRLLLELKERMA